VSALGLKSLKPRCGPFLALDLALRRGVLALIPSANFGFFGQKILKLPKLAKYRPK
jgi:hypothetical protein